MTMAGWGAARIHVAVGVSGSVDLSVTVRGIMMQAGRIRKSE